MKATARSIVWIVSLALLCAGCGGGGGGGGGSTTVRGRIVLPAADKCAGCTNAQQDVVVFGPGYNAAPGEVLVGFDTDAAGNYDTGDISAELDAYQAAPDVNGDGTRTLLVVATVNSNTGAQIGGAVSLPEGESVTKDFNPTTHVACLAVVFLTTGTESFGDPGCTVRADCRGQPDCLTTEVPDRLNSLRIATLESAADIVAAQVTFPAGVPAAACAVLDCTRGGTRTATAECMNEAF